MVNTLACLIILGLASVDAFAPPFPSAKVSPLSHSLKSATRSIWNAYTRRQEGGCPAIWNEVSSALTTHFLDGSGQCTDAARAAIRFAFHDAGTFSNELEFYEPAAGGADGSLLLSPDEINRPENGGLQRYHEFLTGFYATYSDRISASDLIQFAASHATITCPGGPKVKTVVGRKDTNTAPPTGLLPAGFGPNSSHDVLFKLFQAKGFSAADLAALIGAHTASKAFAQEANGIPVGGPQDTTPGKWDVDYYSQTINPPSDSKIYRFESDINLSKANTTVGKEFNSFVGNQGKWASAYADAMARMSVLGIPAETVQGFVDCTGALPHGTSSKRDIRARPINDRVR